MRKCLSFVGLAFIAACGVRSSNPVSISQPGDKALSCAQIVEQVEANNTLAIEKAGGVQATEDQNVATIAVATVVFWPAMLAIDLSSSDQIELRALRDRNRSLERLHRTKNC